MYSEKATLKNKSGLHARPAATFARHAKRFSSRITVRNLSTGSDPENAKNVVGLLSLGANKGMELEICAEGEDEVEAVLSIVHLMEGGLGE